MNKILCARNADLGMFLIRLGLAAVFIVHGWMKLGSMDATIGFFATLGLPAMLAWAVALVEFVGGIAMLLGAYTCVAGGLLAVVMLGAIIVVKGQMGFVGGYEFDLTLMLAALGVAFAGPGKYAVRMKATSKACGGGVCKM